MQSVLARLHKQSAPSDIFGLQGSSVALFLSRAAESMQGTICCLLPADEQIDTLSQDIAFFSTVPVLTYPGFEIPPYTPLSPDPATVCTRLASLYHLHEQKSGPCILLCSIEASLRRVLPAIELDRRSELIIAGEETDREGLISALVASGYQHCDMVRQEGDMALRGGIIDVYPPSLGEREPGPVRLDFFDNTVESIRVFDPLSQRSRKELTSLVLIPATDLLFPKTATAHQDILDQLDAAEKAHNWATEEFMTIREQFARKQPFPGIENMLPLLYGGREKLQTLFDFLPGRASIVLTEPLALRQRHQLLRERILANFVEAQEARMPVLAPDELFVSEEEWHNLLQARLLAKLSVFPDPESEAPSFTIPTGDHSLLAQEMELHRKKHGLLAPLAERIRNWQQQGERTVLACRSIRQANHLREMLANYQLPATLLHAPLRPESIDQADTLFCCDHPLTRGFELPGERWHFLSALELFGEKRLGRSRGKRRAEETQPLELDQLNIGDTVVHRDHGIGLFQGLVNLEFSGRRGDFMLISYQGDDKLYVPVDRLHWVSRYHGLTDQEPKLDSLGSTRWQSAKRKVTDAVWKIAQELLDIYARRAMRKGRAFSAPGDLYRQMEESFPYDETSGQAKAIDDVISDLTREQPMDRLVCGDVGYGKTEVAARAAFKVIEDGFQVAMLVPTTVLAEQHSATLCDRFAGFPLEIACLNRFRTKKEQKEILGDLANGKIHLLIGTHRLLSKDVRFRQLGLLIVDEEHRFGVAHKEKIKKFKAEVDVLTLTATPIPRTLQMSLLGIRDLSVISTPPRQRRSVKTFLARYDQLVIREAIMRELERGGQLFFVHNRVQSIHHMADTIASLVPQARIGVAHGQMAGAQLEEIMVRFVQHELDILVCTTIIESGLDIPNANTIIINRADHLGLADIYQLRGRVGRANRQAYAYLLVASLDHLTADAQKRLRALMDASELGGGFKLSMNDLQIRGGGNLLGVSQSGHIAAVGYDLYLELLQSTVEELKRKALTHPEQAETADIDPEINLNIAAFLPDTYISDTTQRYHIYRRLSMAGSGDSEELITMEEELVDRYGPLPKEARTLLDMIILKQKLRALGINKLEQAPDALVFCFVSTPKVDPQRILMLVQRKTGKKQEKKTPEKAIRLTPDRRLIVPLARGGDIFVSISAVLTVLEG